MNRRVWGDGTGNLRNPAVSESVHDLRVDAYHTIQCTQIKRSSGDNPTVSTVTDCSRILVCHRRKRSPIFGKSGDPVPAGAGRRRDEIATLRSQ